MKQIRRYISPHIPVTRDEIKKFNAFVEESKDIIRQYNDSIIGKNIPLHEWRKANGLIGKNSKPLEVFLQSDKHASAGSFFTVLNHVYVAEAVPTSHICICADGANYGSLYSLIVAILDVVGKDGIFGFPYTEFDDPQMPDHIGGGVFIVTREGYRLVSTTELCEEADLCLNINN